MDKLNEHLEGILKEANKIAESIQLPGDAPDELKELVEKTKNSFDLSGDLIQKQTELNNLLDAFKNYR